MRGCSLRPDTSNRALRHVALQRTGFIPFIYFRERICKNRCISNELWCSLALAHQYFLIPLIWCLALCNIVSLFSLGKRGRGGLGSSPVPHHISVLLALQEEQMMDKSENEKPCALHVLTVFVFMSRAALMKLSQHHGGVECCVRTPKLPLPVCALPLSRGAYFFLSL